MTAAVPTFPTLRLRRLRSNPSMRDLVRETHLQVTDFVQPLFIMHGKNVKQAIPSMPGQFQYSVDQLEKEINEISELGIPAVLLFGIPEKKDSIGSSSHDDEGVIQKAIGKIKHINPDILVITDNCFCDYTGHGHCGIMNDKTGRHDLDNDASLEILKQQVLSHVRAGADVVAPSGMLDGMVHALRTELDSTGYSHIPIMSYSVKFASSMYGPFREATDAYPKYGDRKSYQVDPANGNEGLREAELDMAEGADILMVKPAHTYLDLITRVKGRFPEIPLAAYHVSGEYAMIKAAAANGWLDEKKAMTEVLTSIKRAGADIIITYASKDAAKWLQQ